MRLQELAIDIPRQSTGSNELSYQLDKGFFQLFENALVENGQLVVNVKLDKSSRHIQLLFEIEGELELICDRSLEQFGYPIFIERTVYFKLGHESKELDVDLYMIEETSSTINLAQHIYDFVTLAVPMKRLHPRFRTEE
jgi:uncharacterized metal-binding protein YceD (DUF177 family)